LFIVGFVNQNFNNFFGPFIEPFFSMCFHKYRLLCAISFQCPP